MTARHHFQSICIIEFSLKRTVTLVSVLGSSDTGYRYNELWGIITVNSGILHDEAQFCHDQVQEAMRISHNAQREFLMLKDKLEMVPTMLGHMDNFKERFGTCL